MSNFCLVCLLLSKQNVCKPFSANFSNTFFSADGFLVDKSPIPHSQKAHIDFVPYEKEDIAVFEWVSSQIGTEIGDYNA